MRYHTDLGIPTCVPDPIVGMTLRYNTHARDAAQHDHVQHQLPAKLPRFELIEVETTSNGVPLQWVVRTALNLHQVLVLVLTTDYRVKTVWVNRREDTHLSLNSAKYDRPRDTPTTHLTLHIQELTRA